MSSYEIGRVLDAEANLRHYLADRDNPTGRYASFDYCFNYFKAQREAAGAGSLIDPGRLQTSCLQLGFYLASWGMFRGSAELLTRSVKCFVPAVETIVDAPPEVWDINADRYEQERIVHLARSRAGVTVQGPPGTGKSHTIANIISHYVAQGKRVLVTAEKEQALKVLGDKIPEGIRDLTVSVLGADDEGRRRLETSISEIQTRVTGLDRTVVDRNITRLYGELDRTDRDIAAATERIFRNRAAEVATLAGNWVAGNDLTPSVAARWVAEYADTLNKALVVSDDAVKRHLTRLYDKFGIVDSEERRRVQLANEALARGAVNVSELRNT